MCSNKLMGEELSSLLVEYQALLIRIIGLQT